MTSCGVRTRESESHHGKAKSDVKSEETETVEESSIKINKR
jgi:hypothetical protein